MEPLQHYLTSGWREGRDPYYTFDTSYYLDTNPDVAAAGVNPLMHFLQSGFHEGRTSCTEEKIVLSALPYAQPPAAIRDHVESADSRDDFTFVAPYSGTLNVFLSNLGADADLRLYDQASCTIMQSSANGGTSLDFVSANVFGEHDYSLVVESFGVAETDYSLHYWIQ